MVVPNVGSVPSTHSNRDWLSEMQAPTPVGAFGRVAVIVDNCYKICYNISLTARWRPIPGYYQRFLDSCLLSLVKHSVG